MSTMLSVRDYDHHLHDFILRGNVLSWYFTSAGADHRSSHSSDATFDAAALRDDIANVRLGFGARAGPIGRYRLRRDGDYLGLVMSCYPDYTFWFDTEVQKDLDWLLSLQFRKVVSV